MLNLPLCLVQYLFEFLDIISQVNMLLTNKYYYNNLYIKKYSNYAIQKKTVKRSVNLSPGIFAQKCFSKLQDLELLIEKHTQIPVIKNTSLKILKIDVNYDVKMFIKNNLYKKIKQIKSTVLNINYMPDLSELTLCGFNIKKLNCSYFSNLIKLNLTYCYIRDFICGCVNLLELDITGSRMIQDNNPKFSFPKLQKLICNDAILSEIDIRLLNPVIIEAVATNLQDLSFMSNLKWAYVNKKVLLHPNYKIRPKKNTY